MLLIPQLAYSAPQTRQASCLFLGVLRCAGVQLLKIIPIRNHHKEVFFRAFHETSSRKHGLIDFRGGEQHLLLVRFSYQISKISACQTCGIEKLLSSSRKRSSSLLTTSWLSVGTQSRDYYPPILTDCAWRKTDISVCLLSSTVCSYGGLQSR